MAKNLEKIVEIIKQLQSPPTSSPEQFFDAIQDALYEYKMKRGPVANAIEYEAWNCTEAGLDSWFNFLQEWKSIMEKSANELEFFLKLYKHVIYKLTGQQAEGEEDAQVDRERGSDT